MASRGALRPRPRAPPLRPRPQRPSRRRPARASRCIPGRSPTWSATCGSRRSRSSSSSPSNPGDGRTAAAAMVFWLIAAGDYLDGFLARVTGQYSRLGALLDPLVDRLTILAGAVVCWHFELLPRWALACSRCASWRCSSSPSTASATGSTSRVNWPGRISVFPIMGGIFFALVVRRLGADGAADRRPRAGDPRHRALRARRHARGAPRHVRCKLSAQSRRNLQPSVEPLALGTYNRRPCAQLAGPRLTAD